MRAVDIIRKKRAGVELSREEIGAFVREYVVGTLPDYQMSAFLMAVAFRGMTEEELAVLTQEMWLSGEVIDLSALPGRKVDKHSTGGVGDKTSLILAPAVAAAGLFVPMISGRGLAHTGGTLDKLESIPGFNVCLSAERFAEFVATAGVCLIGQTENLVPADRKMYALRDVTGTVDCIPLIAASIMSKKLAEGSEVLVLDVKTGSGAFMKSMEDAEALARAMVGIGKACGRKVVGLITDMNQPLGRMVGNSLEVIESLETLKGKGPEDLVMLCRELSAYCLWLGGAAADLPSARELYDQTIQSGKALEKFREIIRLQGGNSAVVEDYALLPNAARREPVPAPSRGFIAGMDTEMVGIAMCVLGAGRERVDSAIDPAVGMEVHKKIGDAVEAGEALCTIHYNDESRFRDARARLLASYRFSATPVRQPVLIHKVIS